MKPATDHEQRRNQAGPSMGENDEPLGELHFHSDGFKTKKPHLLQPK